MSPTPPPRAPDLHSDASASAGSTRPDTAPNVQRRVLLVLASAQGVAGVAVATAAAVGPVAVAAVSGSAALGGASTTSLVLGTAASALVIARIADRAGRRPALALGYLTGAVGAGLAAVGNAAGSWPLMLFAFLAFGAGNAAGLAARFAATDLAAPNRRAHAVGVVMWATTLGAVAGPALAGPVAHGSPWAPATGVLLLGAVTFGFAALVVGAGLRPDPCCSPASRSPGQAPSRP